MLGMPALYDLFGTRDIDAVLPKLNDVGVRPHVSCWNDRRSFSVCDYQLRIPRTLMRAPVRRRFDPMLFEQRCGRFAALSHQCASVLRHFCATFCVLVFHAVLAGSLKSMV
jgi:hypothetical protein